MPEFRYRAVDSSGQTLEGILSAESPTQAKYQLHERGLIVLEIKVQQRTKSPELNLFRRKKGVDDRELYTLFRELAIMLRSGVTLDRAIATAMGSTRQEEVKRRLEKVLRGIREGKSVTQAFVEAGFDQQVIRSMIAGGEAIGKLSLAFENLADYLQFRYQLRSEIINALIYPVFLTIASLITVFVIFRFILPRFFSLFAGIELPLPARVLYFMGQVISKLEWYHWILFLGGIYLLWQGPLRGALVGRVTQLLFKLPILKGLLKDLDYARFSHSMHSFLKSGIDFVDALMLSKNVLLQQELRNYIENAVLEIRKGQGIAQVFGNTHYFSPLFASMLKVGEESGSLVEIFWELYIIHEDRFKNGIKRLLSLLEPLIITVTGIFVGIIVVSLILTVMSAGVLRF